MIVFVNNETEKYPIDASLVEELCQFVLVREHQLDNTEVCISFVGLESIQQLNKQYRGIDKPTDVLSFRANDDEEFDKFIYNQQEKVNELGDVIISPDQAHAQCSLYGATFNSELCFLIVHGLLHLCGYDHIDNAQAQKMQEREKALLKEWALEHGAIKLPSYIENFSHPRGLH